MIGFINNAGIGVLVVYTSNLSSKFDRNLRFAMFAVFLEAVPIISRILISTYFIQVNHENRMICASALFMCSYVAIAFSIEHSFDENTTLPCAVVACILHQLGRATGEATILGYMKALP